MKKIANCFIKFCKLIHLKSKKASTLEIAISQNNGYTIDHFIPLFIDYIDKNEQQIICNPSTLRDMLMVKMYRMYHKSSTEPVSKNSEDLIMKIIYSDIKEKDRLDMELFNERIKLFFCNYDNLIKYQTLFDRLFVYKNYDKPGHKMTFSIGYDWLFFYLADQINQTKASEPFKSYYEKKTFSDTIKVCSSRYNLTRL